MKRHALILGYGILVLLIVVGAIRLEAQRAQVELESLRRSHVLCVSLNDLREDILEYVNETPPLPEPPDGLDPATREYIEEIRDRADDREVRLGRFERLECPPSPDEHP